MSKPEVIDLDDIAGEIADQPVKIGGKLFYATGDPDMASLVEMSRLADSKLDFQGDRDGSLQLLERFLAAIFGEEQAPEVMKVCGIRKLSVLMPKLIEMYELGAGKVQGSNRQQRRTGARSQPTSNGSTKSTSAKRVSAAKKNGSVARTSRV